MTAPSGAAPRIGVVGCGAIARRQHIPALLAAGAELTAFASQSVASAELARAEAGSGTVCADWRELLGRADIDAVTICTPNALHAEQALAALAAGKHVLVEKPLTVTVAEADRIVTEAARTGLVAMTAHSARYAPAIAAMRAALSSGAVGTPTSVDAVFCHSGPTAWAPEASWFADVARAGGGALLDLGVHLIDALRWMLDDEFARVAASLADGPVEPDAVVLFTTRAGVTGTLHAGWRSVPGARVAVTVMGDAGTLVLDDRGVVLHRPASDPSAVPLGEAVDSPQAAFVRSIAAGTAEGPSVADGRAAVAVVEACYRAAAEARTVEVE